jgi:hypothetical protein
MRIGAGHKGEKRCNLGEHIGKMCPLEDLVSRKKL